MQRTINVLLIQRHTSPVIVTPPYPPHFPSSSYSIHRLHQSNGKALRSFFSGKYTANNDLFKGRSKLSCPNVNFENHFKSSPSSPLPLSLSLASAVPASHFTARLLSYNVIVCWLLKPSRSHAKRKKGWANGEARVPRIKTRTFKCHSSRIRGTEEEGA